MSYIFNRENYECAKMNGDTERFRSDEISRRIGEEVPSNQQQALQTNMINDLINGQPLSHLEEWQKYQVIRAKVKAEVDEEIKIFEKE